MRLIPAGLFAAVLLSACTETAPVPPQMPQACSDEYLSLVGMNIGATSFPAGLPYRVLQPGAQATQDYEPARLNLYVDDKGWITRVTCG